jgi:hypothetical protein
MKQILFFIFLFFFASETNAQVFGFSFGGNAIKPHQDYSNYTGLKMDIDFTRDFDVDKRVGTSISVGYCHYSFKYTTHSQGQGTKNYDKVGDGIGFGIAFKVRLIGSGVEKGGVFLVPYAKIYTVPKYWNNSLIGGAVT